MAYDEKLADRIRRAAKEHPAIREKKMFGGAVFMAGEHMFRGVQKNNLLVRVPPDQHESLLA